MQIVYVVLTLLLTVGATRVAAHLLPLPLPLIQITAGALLATPMLGFHIKLEPELFMLLFIPPLLFADGWRMPKNEFWQMRWPILTLAFGLVLFTVIGGGIFISHLLPQVPLPVAFALAAVLSPTDALAVSAIAEEKLPKKLMCVLQGEALMNDASGLVAFKFAVAAAVTGYFSLPEASIDFLIVAVGGLGTGVILGWLLGRVRGWMVLRGWEDAALHVVLLILLPFASYIAAENLGVSGILAAVAAGMMQSWADLLPRQTSTRLLNRSVWSMLEFSFNGVVFLLLGLQLPDILNSVAQHSHDVLWQSSLLLFYVLSIFVALFVLRFVWVWGYLKLSLRFKWMVGGDLQEQPQDSVLRIASIAALGGVRGAVTLAGILSVPLFLGDGSAFPQRDLIIFIAAGVILMSLFSAAVGLPLLLRDLSITKGDVQEIKMQSAWRETAAAAIHALENEELAGFIASNAEDTALMAEAKAELMAEYRRALEIPELAVTEVTRQHVRGQLDHALRVSGLRAQRTKLYSMRRSAEIGDEVLLPLLHRLDAHEAWLSNKYGRWI
ncbi:Na+/H+ antiporter [Pseudomonas sp. BN505]|uniref:Na+/H+ antiporter n=1 Tax=unclassified Pseudomonas TaxID=196821 RepID=UPI002458A249|nr:MULTISPECIES: Na+/H+ antiporter [unclassified Pseudomonas]MDH4842259.1 Na+/H+ antiporter [Pseudomonas sp. BN605]MDH4855114.1 Na+/H+ antiporter [Pseudomonas sp. BN505]